MRWTETQAQLLVSRPEPVESLFAIREPAVYAWWDLSGCLERFYPQEFPPVDHRQPLYVGSAADDLGKRIKKYHRRRVGGSSPRFSLASLLAIELHLLPGASIRDGKVKLERTAEARLTVWMSNHLLFTKVQLASGDQALEFEDRIIKDLLPPLNIAKADRSPYRDALAATRSALRSAIAAGPRPRDDQDF